MESVRCCECSQQVRLPDAPSNADVRCPLCGATYPVQRLLDGLPPLLEVIPAPGVPAPAPVAGVPGAQPQKPIFELPGESVPIPSPLAGGVRRSARSGPSGFWTIVKVALGGVAGLALGQLILWWLPPAYRSDPAQLAKQLPPALAFLAPASLRGVEPLPAPVEPTDPNAPFAPPEGTPDTDVSMPPGGTWGLADAQSVSAGALNISLRQAQREVARTNDMAMAWSALQAFAFDVTYADMQSSGMDEAAQASRAWLAELAVDPQRLMGLSRLVAQQLTSSPSAEVKGTLFAGDVRKVRPVGKLFQSDLALVGDPKRTVAVVSRVDPAAAGAFAEGDRVLIAGVVVHDPALQLMGYQGEADPVVFGGLPHNVSAGRENK